MSVLPFLRIYAPLNAVLAAPGLLAVAGLTMPNLSGRSRLALGAVLAVIWVAYLLQMAETLLKRWAGNLRDRTPAIAIDVLAVLVPLAAFLLVRTPDWSLYCVVWLLKPLRDSTFFPVLGRVLANEARNLIGVTTLFGVVLFGVALAAYIIERDIQPEKFGSIPQAMWWAVVTLSTTGYGDAIPQSFAGRVLSGAVMMCGIGVFALWAGILASGF